MCAIDSRRWSMPARSGAPPPKTAASLELIRDEYRRSEVPWILGFSGGKDSSAVLRLVFRALATVRRPDLPVTVVYCDTGVEIPVVAQLVRRTLRGVAAEAREAALPLTVKVARPLTEDSYFVKVIGRGYPPPTNKFRWCTDRLRIRPVQRMIANLSEEGSLVVLGVRKGESTERDRTLRKFETERPFVFRQAGYPSSLVFAPALNYTTEEIWETVLFMPDPMSLDGRRLWSLYGQAAGEECPLIRDPNGSPCSRGRFGCWTCTVVRKDEGVAGLIEAGQGHLVPLLEFRDWLQRMRDDPANRCPRRRNGGAGPGPLTLEARRAALRRLRVAERRSGLPLIKVREVELIHRLWREDRRSPAYMSIERAVTGLGAPLLLGPSA
jgi:DNA sulfur modification protein DndC